MIERVWDEETGIIYVSGLGEWTQADVDDHYSALRRMIGDLRREGKPIRVLSDISQATRQGYAREEHILTQMRRTFRAGDRVAMVTAGASDKAYVRSIVTGLDIAVFASKLPAEMWLLLDEVGAPPPSP
ncbi:hypothetical protein HZF05_13105 [Sphingomonas sp. CGMCC 1.13654]|uniref:STAS/SEC14 domain-containing protein n=1 Tax=Sphingomonas chungangi TaxID=2683589 RepID=A0A838L6C1_9SPHN|nr:hypothetical protein [Sphingomonas chungangi]MBA2935033.1 hypothetical protein [Sphingomonas chungangi]MVW54149.1 hypothetical protein [Sphingomonas chungangi]